MKKKKVALFGLGSMNWIGGIQYITNIIHALDSVSNDIDLEVHLIKRRSQSFSDIRYFKNIDLHIHDVEACLPPWTLKNRGRWFLQRKFGGRVIPRMENFFIRHKFDFVYPVTLSGCRGKLNSAGWIADFQHIYYPKGASEEFTRSAENELSHIAQFANKVVLSSDTCERDCVKFYPASAGKTFSLPFTVFINPALLQQSNFTGLVDRYRIPEEFLIVSNSFCPTKNHKTLFQALALLNKRGIKVNLVCTGNIVDQRNLHFANEILQSLTDNGVRSQVYLLGIIPREHQVALYRMSKAIVQPSLNEGWSTSVEEAKALGKDLIVSDIDVHKEQSPGNPYMFERLNASDLAQKIEEVWKKNQDLKFPDVDREQTAFTDYQEQVKRFGQRFLELVSK